MNDWYEREIARLKKENKQLKEAIPKTPQEIMEFIGPNFCSMRTAGNDGNTYTDLSNVLYVLTVHDLLSAFSWVGLDAASLNKDNTEKDSKT